MTFIYILLTFIYVYGVLQAFRVNWIFGLLSLLYPLGFVYGIIALCRIAERNLRK